jgi:hypothetical protein
MTAPTCTCDPRHLEVGGYDPDCPVHDTALVPHGSADRADGAES